MSARRDTPARFAVHLYSIAAAMVVTGCASGAFNSERPVSQVYTISAAAPESAAATALPIDVAVARPLPRAGLDTERIASLRRPALRLLRVHALERRGG